MRVYKRVIPFSQPSRRLPPKIPNPLPKTSSKPILTESNCLFYNLRSNEQHPPSDKSMLPPLLKDNLGGIVNRDTLARMRQLFSEDKAKWTIAELCRQFKVCRSYVIKNVMSETEAKKLEAQMEANIDNMSFKGKKGWLMRYKIREHRRDLW